MTRSVGKVAGFILIAALLLSSVYASSSTCNPACGSHGNCDKTTLTCVCDIGFVGDDCSIRMSPLTNLQSINAVVEKRDWMYFETTAVPKAVTFTYTVSQNETGDKCDLYIRAGNLPGRILYDQKETSSKSTFSIAVTVGTGVTYYAGVYGVDTCNFTISLQVTYSDLCPNSCSGHGTCAGGVCTCEENYYYSDCSEEILELSEDDSQYSINTGFENDWVLFISRPVLQVDQTYEPFSVSLESDDLTNSYIYEKWGSVPTLYDFDYRTGVAVEGKIKLNIGKPINAIAYFAIVIGSPSNVTVSITYGLNIRVYDCSQHGVVQSGNCNCSVGYTGSNCEIWNSNLSEGELYNGFVQSNQWNYYTLSVNSQSNVLVSVIPSTENTADCSLFVNSNTYPTLTNYTYRKLSTNAVASVTIINPLGSYWYIGVYSAYYCQYNLEYTFLDACPDDCSGHGECVENNRCDCDENFIGESCQYPLFIVTGNPTLYSGSITNSHWVFYKISAPHILCSITFSLLEMNSTGFINIYYNIGGIPTLTNYYDSDTEIANVHALNTMVPSSDSNRDYYFGVYGTSFIPLTKSFEYKVGSYIPMITFNNTDNGSK